MKKLMMVLLSALMVLTVGMSVSASAGEPWNVEFATNVPGKETSSIVSNWAGGYRGGTTITLEAKDVEGYEFSNWTATIYGDKDYDANSLFSNTNDPYTTFTLPSEGYGTVKITANFDVVKATKVETEGNLTDAANTSYIANAVAKQAGVEVTDGDEVKLTAVVEDVAVSDSVKKTVEEVAASWGVTVANSSVGKDIKLAGTIIAEDGSVKKELTAGEVSDLGNGWVHVDVSYSVPAEVLNTPSGYTRYFYVIALHENGKNDLYYVDSISASNISFWANKFSTFVLAYEDILNDTTTPAGPKDTNSDGIVDCVEENGKGWVWSSSKNVCVYKVTNTSAK